MRQYTQNQESYDSYLKKAYHYRLLHDAGLVYSEVTIHSTKDGTVPVWISRKGLTMAGHEALDAMRNDTIWNKINDKVKLLGVEGLKQIPALAIKLIEGVV